MVITKKQPIEMNTPLFKSFAQTIVWLVFNTVLGVVPLLIMIFIDVVLITMEIDYYKEIVENGLILFLCVSVSGSVMVDHLFMKKRFSKSIEFLISAFPLILTIITSLTFTMLFFYSDKLIFDKALLLNLQYFIVVLTIVYCLFMKTLITLYQCLE